MKTIHSKDNPFFKQLVKLGNSARERKASGLTVLDGIHLVAAYCESGRIPKQIAISESSQQRMEVQQLLNKIGDSAVVILDDALMAQASSLESPAFVIALIDTPSNVAMPLRNEICVVLDNIQDPGNVGSILRSAAAAGVKQVLLSNGTAAAWSPKVLRAAQGAHFSLVISEDVDVLAFIKIFSGNALALTPHGEKNLFDCDLKKPVAWLIGNEGAGLDDVVMKAAAARVTIPMPGKAESLNAAASAAICLFEMVRQRQLKG